MPAHGQPLEIGKGRLLREGTKIALFSFGALADCLTAADELPTLGLSTTVADARRPRCDPPPGLASLDHPPSREPAGRD